MLSATVVASAIANLLMLTLSEHLVAAVVPLLDVLSGVSRHPVAELVDEDLHHYPHSVDQQFQGGRHHGRPSTSSNRSLLTASVITFAAISPTLRLWKCASITSHPSRSCDSGSSMICSRPRYCIRSANFARCSGIVGSSLDCCGGRPVLGLGRRKLIPSREQVTCSEPSVTPIVSAICSRLKPRSTSFLICWSRSGVNLIGRPLAAVGGTADPLASNIGTVPSCLTDSGVRFAFKRHSAAVQRPAGHAGRLARIATRGQALRGGRR